uniref:Uncharacterized protein n=1 Tax=Oryza glumipatula TaxID=40148 RepID=A0A0E0AAH0_9ORYZ
MVEPLSEGPCIAPRARGDTGGNSSSPATTPPHLLLPRLAAAQACTENYTAARAAAAGHSPLSMEASEVRAHDQYQDDRGHDRGGLELARLIEVWPQQCGASLLDLARERPCGSVGPCAMGQLGGAATFGSCDNDTVASGIDGEQGHSHIDWCLAGGGSLPYSEALDVMGSRWRCHIGRRLAAGALGLWRRGIGTMAVGVGGPFGALRRVRIGRRNGTGVVEFMCW